MDPVSRVRRHVYIHHQLTLETMNEAHISNVTRRPSTTCILQQVRPGPPPSCTEQLRAEWQPQDMNGTM